MAVSVAILSVVQASSFEFPHLISYVVHNRLLGTKKLPTGAYRCGRFDKSLHIFDSNSHLPVCLVQVTNPMNRDVNVHADCSLLSIHSLRTWLYVSIGLGKNERDLPRFDGSPMFR
jgi:hypothetical protein